MSKATKTDERPETVETHEEPVQLGRERRAILDRQRERVEKIRRERQEQEAE